jgi:hypothetical protein
MADVMYHAFEYAIMGWRRSLKATNYIIVTIVSI